MSTVSVNASLDPIKPFYKYWERLKSWFNHESGDHLPNFVACLTRISSRLTVQFVWQILQRGWVAPMCAKSPPLKTKNIRKEVYSFMVKPVWPNLLILVKMVKNCLDVSTDGRPFPVHLKDPLTKTYLVKSCITSLTPCWQSVMFECSKPW